MNIYQLLKGIASLSLSNSGQHLYSACMPANTLISRLRSLSEIDANLLRIVSERKKLQKQYEQLNQEIEALKKDLAQLQAKSAKDKASYERESNKVKVERESLAARRRALATLGNYKLQEAASREIDAAEALLSSHEDTLVNLLDSSDISEKSATERELLLLDKEEARSEMVKNMKPSLDTLAERQAKHEQARAEIAATIDSKDLATYEGVRKKMAPDTLAPIVSGACDFCNLQTPPQMLILVASGNSIQKCRGCSRILFVPGSEANSD